MSALLVEQHSAEYMNEYCGGELIATAVSFIILELTFAAVRFWAHKRQRRNWGVDDWLMFPALLANLCVCITGIVMIPVAGVGYHIDKILKEAPWKLIQFQRGIFAGIWVWGLAIALPKLAILAFYLRFFKSRNERIVTYVLMGIIASTYVAISLAHTFACMPVGYQLNPFKPGKGQCFDTKAFYRWMSFPNIVTDIVMLVLPLPMVHRLHTSHAQKIGLGIIFATGGIGLITSCCRFAIFYSDTERRDDTWKAASLHMWTEIEPGVYFLAACMPSFPPLIQLLRTRFVRSKRGSSQTYPSGHKNIALYTIGGSARLQDSVPLTPSNTHEDFPPLSDDEETARKPAIPDYNEDGGFRHSVAYADLAGIEAARTGSPRTLRELWPPRRIRVMETVSVRHDGFGSLDGS
ncbi:hypothetical protein BO86DRAFT_395840 [Aspergillus japonicus CBS 114.51]|uniref:Rhodopsin domain-containing protein n=1 Tax=Aspergillus japonicus CBS 114.51 TaxID=1448312 RepID=A0A8T8XDV7_ASPJA|nr:hypothetical protein BO86DRAFT_395840 [Aspergillus japonicus CBS 114.51]RAH85539.1 hypothetical protein BO86DRAFT_395840 [Aspergillus japonicus CBS 114.51]